MWWSCRSVADLYRLRASLDQNSRWGTNRTIVVPRRSSAGRIIQISPARWDSSRISCSQRAHGGHKPHGPSAVLIAHGDLAIPARGSSRILRRHDKVFDFRRSCLWIRASCASSSTIRQKAIAGLEPWLSEIPADEGDGQQLGASRGASRRTSRRSTP
jgi:hypothetical protein